MSTQPFNPASSALTAPTPAVAPPVPTLEDLLGAARPPARVSLLPREVVQARALRRAQRVLAVSLAGVVAVLAAGWWVSARAVDAAEEELLVAQARTAALTAEQAEFAEVPRVLAQLEAARTARRTAMAGDVLWYGYLDGLTRSIPTGVWLGNLTVSTGGAGSATPAPGSAAAAAVATASFSGTAFEHPQVADWLDALDATEGFADARYSTSTRTELEGETVVDFESTVTVTTDALSHRFDSGGPLDGEDS